MKLKELNSVLQDYYSKVIGAVGKDGIPKNIKITVADGKVSFQCTDVEISLTVTETIHDNAIDSCEDGIVCIDGKTFGDILKKLPKENYVTIKSNDNDKVTVSSGKFRNSIKSVDSSLYPAIELSKNQPYNTAVVNAKKLSVLLDKQKFCIASDSYRIFLRGAFFNFDGKQMTLSTADGHLLSNSIIPCETANEFSFILPKKSVDNLVQLLNNTNSEDVTINVAQNGISVTQDNIEFLSVLIEANYPDITTLFNFTQDKSMFVNCKEFTDVIKRALITTNNLNKAVQLKSSAENLTVLSRNTSGEQSEETISVMPSGKDFDIAFNGEYLINIISKIDTENCELIGGNSNNVIIRPARNDENTNFTDNISFVISRVVV
jgi:DNA polymerase-3 subunit beta